MTLLATALGNLVFAMFLIIFFLGIVYGFWTRTGSGIDRHGSASGKLRTAGGAGEEGRIGGRLKGEQDPSDTHGTR